MKKWWMIILFVVAVFFSVTVNSVAEAEEIKTKNFDFSYQYTIGSRIEIQIKPNTPGIVGKDGFFLILKEKYYFIPENLSDSVSIYLTNIPSETYLGRAYKLEKGMLMEVVFHELTPILSACYDNEDNNDFIITHKQYEQNKIIWMPRPVIRVGLKEEKLHVSTIFEGIPNTRCDFMWVKLYDYGRGFSISFSEGTNIFLKGRIGDVDISSKKDSFCCRTTPVIWDNLHQRAILGEDYYISIE